MASRFDFGHMEWKWVLVSIVIFLVAQVLFSVVFGVLGILTLGIGFILFVIIKPVTYFVGGYLTGLLSPGVTLAEPAIGAVVITLLGSLFDISRIHHGRLGWAIISSIVAFIVALIGASFGERAQRSRTV
jgi:hypothetical protein